MNRTYTVCFVDRVMEGDLSGLFLEGEISFPNKETADRYTEAFWIGMLFEQRGVKHKRICNFLEVKEAS